MSPPEARLWVLLRTPPFEPFHLRHQVPLGRYYADFASHAARLVIEVDGAGHTTDEAIAYDAARTAFIASQGYRVLRFTTLDVLHRLDAVAGTVFAACPHPPAAPVPPPHEGEGKGGD
jgi:very-short-patch-repair endonuclease